MQVIQQERKPPLKLLHSRAATHTKLGDLQAAMRDGRAMIQEYKTSCSVYSQPKSATVKSVLIRTGLPSYRSSPQSIRQKRRCVEHIPIWHPKRALNGPKPRGNNLYLDWVTLIDLRCSSSGACIINLSSDAVLLKQPILCKSFLPRSPR